MAVNLDIRANLKVIKDNIQEVVREAMQRARTGAGGGGGGAAGVDTGQRRVPSLLNAILTAVLPVAAIARVVTKFGLLDLIVGLLAFGILFLLKPFVEFVKKTWPVIQGLIEKAVDVWENQIQPKIEKFVNDFPQLLQSLQTLVKEKFDQVLKFWEDKILPFWQTLKDFFENEVKPLLGFIGDVIELKMTALGDIVKDASIFIRDWKQAWENLGVFVSKVLGFIKVWSKNVINWFKNLWSEIRVRMVDLWNKIGELKDKAVEWLKNLVERIKSLPSFIWEKLKGLGAIIANALRNLIGFGRSQREQSVGDAIIKPDGTIIRTDPRDTLIATQTPGNIGGGGNVFNFFGVTQDEFLEKAKRELAVDVFRGGRF